MGFVLPTGSFQPGRRALHHVSFCVHRVRKEEILRRFEKEGIVASGGSACSTGSTLPSHVLDAIGVPIPYIHGSIRMTLSHTNSVLFALVSPAKKKRKKNTHRTKHCL